MIQLNFQSAEEFEKLFKLKDKLVTDAIVEAIAEAMQGNKKTARLFECSFENVEMAYEISLPAREWEVALQSCLDHYHQLVYPIQPRFLDQGHIFETMFLQIPIQFFSLN